MRKPLSSDNQHTGKRPTSPVAEETMSTSASSNAKQAFLTAKPATKKEVFPENDDASDHITVVNVSSSLQYQPDKDSLSPQRPPPASLLQLPAKLRTQLMAAMVVMVVEALAATLPLPFVGLFVAYLSKVELDDAGYISGYLVAAYFLGQVLSGPVWGRLSDTWGRRSVLLIGLAISSGLAFAFGFSTSVRVAIFIRFLQGIGNGNIVVAKTIVSDVTDEWSESVGFASLSLFWSLGAILGSVVGGLMYDPATQDILGSVVSWGPFWTTFPALLPCAAVAVCSLFAMVWVFLFLKETAPQSPTNSATPVLSLEAILPAGLAPTSTKAHGELYTIYDAFRSKETRNAVIIYMSLSASENGTMEILPLWAIAPRSVGGLNFTSSTLGTLLMCSSIFCISGNIMYGRVASYLKSYRMFWDISVSLWVATLLIQPLASRIEDPSRVMVFTTAISSLREVGISWCFSMSYANIARCAPKDHVGALNGIAQSAGSLSRMIFLVLLPPVFAYSLDSAIFNHHLAFVMCAAPLVLTAVLSRKMQFFSS